MRGRTQGRWYVALRVRADVAGHANKAALRFFHRPPTELADGFGREAALPTPDDWPGAGFTPVLRWVPGSPVGRLGGVRTDSPDGDVTTERTGPKVTVVMQS